MKTIQEFMLRPWIYVIIVLLGICLKFYKIDYRYFWYDEVFTIIQTAGVNDFNKDFKEKLPLNEVRNISYYHDMLHLKKHDYTIGSQLKGQWNSTNLNPLHYAVLTFWYRIAGDSDIGYRYFNVFIFLLILPCIFYLAKLLFKSNLAGWIAISLFSVNGFFQYYTFEARYNTLCLFLIILNQIMFIKAVKVSGYLWWAGYLLTGILCLYSSFLLGLIFVAHFIYTLFFERKVFIPYLISSIVIFLAYLPWLISVINDIDKIFKSMAWQGSYGTNQNIFTLVFAQFYFVAYSFDLLNNYLVQVNMFVTHNLAGNFTFFIINLIIIALLIYSAIYTFKKGERKLFVFILLFIIPQFLFFLINDLVRKTGMSLVVRYNILNIIGFILFLVFLFKDKIFKGSYFFIGIFFLLAIMGISTNFYMADKYAANMYPSDIKNSKLLSQSENSLLISDMKTIFQGGGSAGAAMPSILAFTNACKSDKIDILRVSSDVKNIREYFDSTAYKQIFVLNASQKLINNLKSQLGNKMDSLAMRGFKNEWQIKF
jgi:uncharacterized membrane protein